MDQYTANLSFNLESPHEQSIDKPWSHHWLSPGGEKLLSYRRQDSCHWLRFPCLADFLISANAERISCYPLPQVPAETIRHLLLDQVLPRCLAHVGKSMLHASAVQLDKGLLLFLGESGAGKSTLAGNFHQAGDSAVSDDCVWLQESNGRILAVPSYGGLRLWEDSLEALFTAGEETHSMAHYTTKKRVALHVEELAVPEDGVPILALIVISPPEQSSTSAILLERLSQREAFIAVLKQTFQLDLSDRERMTRHAHALGRIVPRIPAYRLSMRRDFSLLSLVRQRIINTVL